MENASKALLIAGGVLIVMVLIGFMLIVKHNVDNFYASEDELRAISDKTKFNEQFTRYNRDDVEGYELITLSNKIIDYNERLSEETTTGNDSHAEPIKIAITLWNSGDTNGLKKVKTLLSYDDELKLFNNKPTLIAQGTSLNFNNKTGGTKVSNLENVLNEVRTIESNKIKTLTKKLSSIFIVNKLKGTLYLEASSKTYKITDADSTGKEADRKEMLSALVSYESASSDKETYKFNSENEKKDYSKVKDKFLKMLNDNLDKMLKYYEYTQFTKAKFKCTKMEYSSTTGRVVNLEFMFTGEIE